MKRHGEEFVTLVDASGSRVGAVEKLEAHQKGYLHLAFSIFLLNDKQQLLLQQRAYRKYHSGGLWSNTCCGHPLPEETVHNAALRRLREEMGVTCELSEVDRILYREEVGNGLIEHELDFLLLGAYHGQVEPNPAEVEKYAWLSLVRLREQLETSPQSFTVWLRPALEKLFPCSGK